MFVHQTSETVQKLAPDTTTGPDRNRVISGVRCDDVAATKGTASHLPTTFDIRGEFAKPNIDDFALAYCYPRHILPSSNNILVQDDGVLACLRALGMASFSLSRRSTEAAVSARSYYLRSLQALSAAVRSPMHATLDNTLLSAMMLSFFETIIGERRMGLEAWSNHVAGTAALLHMRGMGQLRTQDGLTLFLQATTNIMSQCVHHCQRLPQSVRRMIDECTAHIPDPSDPVWKVHTAWAQLVDFLADVVGDHLRHAVVIETAHKLDAALSLAFVDAGSAWHFEIQKTAPNGATVRFQGYYHIYQSSLSAQVWNSMRNGRLVLSDIVIGVAESGAFGVDADCVISAIATKSQMSRDILATVPQHTRCADFATVPRLSTPVSGVSTLLDHTSARLPVLRTARGYQLVWFVASVGSRASVGSEIRVTACEALRTCASALGLQQAAFLAERLERGAVPGCYNDRSDRSVSPR